MKKWSPLIITLLLFSFIQVTAQKKIKQVDSIAQFDAYVHKQSKTGKHPDLALWLSKTIR